MAVGTDATAAYNSLKKKQSELDAIARGLVVTDPVEDENTRLRLRAAKADFLEDIQLSRQRKTWLGYCLSLTYFVECCSKTYVEEIERKDLLRFVVFLRDEKELAPRTVHNKFAELLTFLAAQGVPKLLSKNDRPRFVDQEVEIYEDQQLLTPHSVCPLYHSTQYDFYLMSGFREQETMHVQWENTRSARKTIENSFSRTLSQTYYWLDLGNNAASGQYVLGQPLNARNRRKANRLRTISELYPEIIDAEAGEDSLPSCSAVEALDRQEPFINQTLAASALAMLAQLFRYGKLTHHGAFFNAKTGQMSALPVDPHLWSKTRRRSTKQPDLIPRCFVPQVPALGGHRIAGWIIVVRMIPVIIYGQMSDRPKGELWHKSSQSGMLDRPC
jgi:hypothetical protein